MEINKKNNEGKLMTSSKALIKLEKKNEGKLMTSSKSSIKLGKEQ
jgi:hypothetical protein